ncbi:MFS transporter [Agromyces sp. NPDC049794]|uniref:MFS transporter n=1 Tax=unclassified Agromyces TaxID=2639701 RepID=UPI0033E3DE98
MVPSWPALDPFRERRFGLFFAGQVISNTGTWFQSLALSLVVLEVSGSAAALSAVMAAQFAPLLLLSVPAGRLADRARPRDILLITSFASAVVVAVLALQVATADASLPVIFAGIVLLGTANAFDRVASQAIVYELVGPSRLRRAASLSTLALAAARSIGPGLAGLAFAGFGAGACLAVNAASYLVVFAFVLAIRPSRLYPRHPVQESGSMADAMRTAGKNRPIVVLLVVNVVVSLFALNLMVVVTATVTLTFAGDAVSLGAAHAINAVGAIVGGLIAASRRHTGVHTLVGACLAFAAALGANAAAPGLAVFLAMAPVLGLGVGYYQGVLHGAAQGAVAPAQLGRTMSLVTLGSYGVVPFGAVLMGFVIDASSGRVALAIGAVACVVCAGFVAAVLRREDA